MTNTLSYNEHALNYGYKKFITLGPGTDDAAVKLASVNETLPVGPRLLAWTAEELTFEAA